MKEYEVEVKTVRKRIEKTQRYFLIFFLVFFVYCFIRGPVMEQLSDQVRGWLHEYKAQTGRIPEYTGSERSASRLLLSRQGFVSRIFELNMYKNWLGGTESETSKSTPASSKDSKSKQKDKTAKSPKESKAVESKDEQEGRSKALASSFLPELNIRQVSSALDGVIKSIERLLEKKNMMKRGDTRMNQPIQCSTITKTLSNMNRWPKWKTNSEKSLMKWWKLSFCYFRYFFTLPGIVGS